MARLKSNVLSFETPERSFEESEHGSQREDSIISLYLPGWGRECSDAAKAALLPRTPPISEGNGRGRGTTFIDSYRKNVSRSCGGDFLSLKAPEMRSKSMDWSTAPDLFKGTREGLENLILDLRSLKKNGKKVPVVICHTSGEVFSPIIHEWAILDVPTLISEAVLFSEWDNIQGVPVKPSDFRKVGRGGNPVPVWVRTQQNAYAKRKGIDKVDWALSFSASEKRVAWQRGSMEEFARQVDAACR